MLSAIYAYGAQHGLLLCDHLQGSSEVFYRKVKFWDGEGQDAPPVFHVDGVNYLHVKVCCVTHAAHCLPWQCRLSFQANQCRKQFYCRFVQSPSADCMMALQDGGVLLVATTRDNVSPSLVLELLRRVGGIIKVSAIMTH